MSDAPPPNENTAERVGRETGPNARRRVLKAMGGTAAATLVWSEPTIRGLAQRPAYAASGSGPTCTIAAGVYGPLTLGCVTTDGVEICAVKTGPGHIFQIQLSGGCTFDSTIGSAFTLTDSDGDSATVGVTAGSATSAFTVKNALKGASITTFTVLQTMTVTCP